MIYLGPWKTKKEAPYNVQVTYDSIKILGITNGHNKAQGYSVNFDLKIEKMTTRLNMWSARSLSLPGKVLIAKSARMSNLIYTILCMPVNKKTLIDGQRIINNFIWNQKPPKIKHTALIGDYDEWGLKAPDLGTIHKSIRLAWLARLLEPNCHTTSQGFPAKYGDLRLLLHCTYNCSLLDLSPFYKELLTFYQ